MGEGEGRLPIAYCRLSAFAVGESKKSSDIDAKAATRLVEISIDTGSKIFNRQLAIGNRQFLRRLSAADLRIADSA